MAVEKRFYAKVYDSSGTYKEVLYDTDFSDVPKFSISINGGLSNLVLFTTFDPISWLQKTGKMANVAIGDRIKLYITDKESCCSPIYSGIISGPKISYMSGKRTLALNVLPNSILLSKKVLRDTDGKTTEVSYTAEDVADIFRDTIDKADTQIRYTPESITDTGVNLTATFNVSFSIDVLGKAVAFMNKGWFYYIDGDDIIYLRNHDSGDPVLTKWNQFEWGSNVWFLERETLRTKVHRIYLEKDAKSFELNKDMSGLTNRVLFLGGGDPQLFKQYDNESSINEYGLFEKKITDEQVTTEAEAADRSNREINTNLSPRTRATVDVIDSNFSEHGLDIEDIKPGDKVKVYLNAEDNAGSTRWRQFFWGDEEWGWDSGGFLGINFYIKKITYEYYGARLDIDATPQGTEELAELNKKDFEIFRYKDAPSVPDNI